MLKQRRLPVHWKVLIIPVVAVGVAAGLAIALPASMASTHRTAAPVPGQWDRAKQRVLGTAVHSATGHPPPGTPPPIPMPGGGQPAAALRAGCVVRYTPVTWPAVPGQGHHQ